MAVPFSNRAYIEALLQPAMSHLSDALVLSFVLAYECVKSLVCN